MDASYTAVAWHIVALVVVEHLLPVDQAEAAVTVVDTLLMKCLFVISKKKVE